jgi:hypothetical protein
MLETLIGRRVRDIEVDGVWHAVNETKEQHDSMRNLPQQQLRTHLLEQLAGKLLTKQIGQLYTVHDMENDKIQELIDNPPNSLKPMINPTPTPNQPSGQTEDALLLKIEELEKEKNKLKRKLEESQETFDNKIQQFKKIAKNAVEGFGKIAQNAGNTGLDEHALKATIGRDLHEFNLAVSGGTLVTSEQQSNKIEEISGNTASQLRVSAEVANQLTKQGARDMQDLLQEMIAMLGPFGDNESEAG